MTAVADIQREQQKTMPQEDLSPYQGLWVALRDGHVIASNVDAVALRNDPDVAETDELMPVPQDGHAVLIL